MLSVGLLLTCQVTFVFNLFQCIGLNINSGVNAIDPLSVRDKRCKGEKCNENS